MHSRVRPSAASRRRTVVPAAPVVQPMERDDPMEGIKKLKELLDMGAISQEEFDAKKTELMAKI